MVRISKQEERRSVSKRRPTRSGKKTGSLKDNLLAGYKQHSNSVSTPATFIAKIK